MNLLETLQKLLKEVACMTTQLSFSLQIPEAPHVDLTGKKMASLIINVDNKLSVVKLLNLLDDLDRILH